MHGSAEYLDPVPCASAGQDRRNPGSFKYHYLPGSANGSRSCAVVDTDSTALSIWKLEPGPWSIRRSPPKHGQGSTSQLWTSLFDDMPRFPWQLKSTTWIQDLGAHLLHHNKYTNPQNGSTCTLEPGRPSAGCISVRQTQKPIMVAFAACRPFAPVRGTKFSNAQTAGLSLLI